ncbi:TolC family protein [Chryseobacterium nepalense]|uniref:TolC family protein n=1 Tax=Chryseobacterium nepalense TaxID=1854498 RepID=UPI002E1261E2
MQILLLTNFFIFFNAQNKSTLSINSKSLSVLAEEYKEIYTTAKEIMTNLLAENKTAETNHVDFSVSDISLNKTEPAIDSKNIKFKNTPHLNWVSDMSYNFSPGFGDDDNIFYRARVSSGLDWLALGEGSLKNQKMQNALNEKMRNMDVLEKQKYKKELNHKENLDQVRVAFDAKKIKLLSDYEKLLKIQNDFTAKQNKIGLKNDAEAAQSKYRLDKISIERKSLESLSKTSDNQTFNNEIINSEIPDLIPVENINFSALVKDKEVALKMEKEILDMKRKRDKQPDLRFKLRYNYYSALSRDRNFASVGATINLPVSRSKNDLESENEMKLKENSIQDLQLLYRNRLSEIYRDYYLAKSEIEVLESEVQYLEAELKVNSTNEKSNTFSPAAYLATAEKLLNNQIQICDKKSDLYEKYLDYRMLSGTDDTAENLQKLTNSDNAGNETYIWSSFFTNYSNAYIINLMNHWHINRVFLSIGKVTDLVKVSDFMALAAQNNIQVYRLIGENSYAKTDDGFNDLQIALQDAKNMGFAGVHLDIEPHTFDDYKTNVDLYAQRLINLFTSSKTWCTQNNMDLGVSVPMQLPAEVATALYNNSIMTYIMAYDVLTLDKKLNKTAVIRNILGPDLYVWVFRINDFQVFSDLLDAEAYVQAAGVTKIGYYDLSQMNNFKP